MPSGGGGAAPPTRRPYWVALSAPQPSPAFGASFLSGFLQEPEPEGAAAGLEGFAVDKTFLSSLKGILLETELVTAASLA